MSADFDDFSSFDSLCSYYSKSSESLGSPFVSKADPSTPELLAKSPPFENRFLILVGDADVKNILEKKISKQQIQAELMQDTAFWGRDCRVIRPDGSHLIPALFLNDDVSHVKLFFALLPQEMDHFYEEHRLTSFFPAGKGFSLEYYKTAIKTASYLNKSCEESSVCIEGGNCRIFTASDGKPKAIIGYTTILLSLVCLHQDFYFEDHLDLFDAYKEKRSKNPISPDQLRIAKNFYLYSQGALKASYIFENPEYPDDPFLTDMAIKVEWMLELTKEKISEDLQIPLDRIAFVFQEQFHIDLELFPVSSPRGDLVFLHDEKLMLDVQQKIDPHPQRAPFLALHTLNYSESHLERNQKIVEHNTKELKKIDCQAVRVPGVLTAQYKPGEYLSSSYICKNWMKDRWLSVLARTDSTEDILTHQIIVNFMNGLYFKDPSPCFITSAPPKGSLAVDQLTKAFIEVVHDVYPELKFSFIRKILPDLLIEYSGSLHCITSVMET